MAFIITLLLVALVAIFILVQPSKVIYIRLFSVPVLCFLFILCLVLLSDASVQSALDGLKLWAGVVVPSLFPFFVAAEIMNSSGFIRASGILLEPVMRPLFNVPGCGSFALVMGILSGYPVGAKITCDMKNNGELSNVEAERLLAFTNNSGPLFIIGAVGTGMYGSPVAGIFMYLCHLLACITVGCIFRFYKAGRGTASTAIHKGYLRSKRLCPAGLNKKRTSLAFNAFRNRLAEDNRYCKTDFGAMLGNAVKGSVSTILTIGGFIVLFSVIIRLLNETGFIGSFTAVIYRILMPFGIDERIIRGVISGLFEVTTGSRLISSISGAPLSLQLPAASLIIGWAGLSVHFQVISIASNTGISISPYLSGKFLQSILSALYAFFGLKLLNMNLHTSEPVLSLEAAGLNNWLRYFGASAWMLLAAIVLFVFINTAVKLKTGCLKQK